MTVRPKNRLDSEEKWLHNMFHHTHSWSFVINFGCFILTTAKLVLRRGVAMSTLLFQRRYLLKRLHFRKGNDCIHLSSRNNPRSKFSDIIINNKNNTNNDGASKITLESEQKWPHHTHSRFFVIIFSCLTLTTAKLATPRGVAMSYLFIRRRRLFYSAYGTITFTVPFVCLIKAFIFIGGADAQLK
jgi:hypothetical protein